MGKCGFATLLIARGWLSPHRVSACALTSGWRRPSGLQARWRTTYVVGLGALMTKCGFATLPIPPRGQALGQGKQRKRSANTPCAVDDGVMEIVYAASAARSGAGVAV
jgi:hypothetical protein